MVLVTLNPSVDVSIKNPVTPPLLSAVDHPLIAIQYGAGFHIEDIRARVWLAQAKTQCFIAPGDVIQVPLAQGLCQKAQYWAQPVGEGGWNDDFLDQ